MFGKNKWLIAEHGKKVASRKPAGCPILKVKELLHKDRTGWNVDLMRQLFTADEIQAIRRIPVSSMGSGDRLVWCSSTVGLYNVNAGSSFRAEGEESLLWKKLRSLDVKRKIQHFLWHACHNSIPVANNLQKRGMRVDGICRQCGEASETVEHLFFLCAKAQIIWKLAPVSWDGLESQTFSFKEWWRAHGKVGQREKLKERQEQTAYIIWHIWKARNSWLYNGQMVPELEVVQQTMEECLEFAECQQKSGGAAQRRMMVDRQKAS